MQPLSLAHALGPEPRILCLGAHPDDIEIGCGGLVLELSAALPGARWHWAVFTGNEARHAEARASARRFLGDDAELELQLASHRDGFLPFEGAALKDRFEALKTRVSPDLVLTHARHDLHQDHRIVSELTTNTWRDHLVLEYEIPKYDGDLGQPQAYAAVSEATANRKAETILDVFETQHSKEWFDRDVLLGLMRLRGIECNAPERYAEAFYARKWRLGLELAR